ncbi:GntP family permease [Streptomyces sp. NPDC056512]|uniref:GntP family permease n=1 Tax=Streptomyces sp. NPDC056512 TaxID=3345846 RepID=UPI003681A76D
MSVSPVYLLGVVLASIALLILLINWRAKMHPFMALMVVSVLAALAAGIPASKVPETIAEGAGGVLGETGIVVFLGAMLGRLLADTGAVSQIADLVIAHSRPKTAPWLVTGVSFLIGVPMFFEVGMVVVLPVLYAVALRLEVASGRPRTWWVRTIVPAVAALSCLHGMLPPHPGPVVAVTGLHADMGLTILLGVICAVPTVIIAGPLYAFWIAPRVSLEPASELIRQFTGVTMDDAISASETGGETTKGGSSAGQSTAGGSQTTAVKATLVAGSQTGRPVSTALAMICVLVPVFLMLAHTVTELAVPGSAIDHVAAFAGSPVIAMLIGVLVTCATLAVQARMSGQQIRDSFGKGLSSIAGVVLIIAGGGAFNAVLKASGIGDAITHLADSVSMNPLLLGWLIGLVLSFCTGSATVGIVSATGILAPMVNDASPAFVSLLVIAIGCGSISLNWVNHSGFWFIKEAFGMTIGQATKTHMTVQTIVSVVGFAAVWVLSLFLT